MKKNSMCFVFESLALLHMKKNLVCNIYKIFCLLFHFSSFKIRKLRILLFNLAFKLIKYRLPLVFLSIISLVINNSIYADVKLNKKIKLIYDNASIFVTPDLNYSFSNLPQNKYQITIRLNNYDDLHNWCFGFFMLYVFVNPQNVGHMTICDVKTKLCESLIVDKKQEEFNLSSFTQPDIYSLGHITLLKPKHNFLLKAGSSYEINIHGLSSEPKNISAVPQKLFLYEKDTNNFINIKSLVNLKSEKIQNKVIKNSAKLPYPTDNIKYTPILPLPQVVKIMEPYRTIYVPYINIPQVYMCNPDQEYYEKNLNCNKIKYQSEGYILEINDQIDNKFNNYKSPNQIVIYANSSAGVFYAKQTLDQLQNYYHSQIPVQQIIDYPRYKYRGIMLDVARHFFSIEEVKKMLDVMASHKLNTLRLHLADDEGWRIELAKYPNLVKIGSVRGFNKVIGASNLIEGYDTNIQDEYQGYYNQNQIKDLIHYANDLQITIIPEIELPGHSRAMKRSLPDLLFEPQDTSNYYTVQGYNDNLLPICKYNIGNNFTKTINNIISEITDLFNGQTTVYAIKNEISISGDEVPHMAFSELKYCEFGQWYGKNTVEITHLFFKNIIDNLPDIKLSGFSQIIEDAQVRIDPNTDIILSPQNVGHIWLWQKSSAYIDKSGEFIKNTLLNSPYDVVLGFADLVYFDMRYTNSWDEVGLYWAVDHADTEDVLKIGKFNVPNAVGVEGALWSELIPNSNQLFYMALPRMSGLAEAGWSRQSNLNWQHLSTRLGNGKTGFLAYLHQKHKVKYHGYPNGI